MNKQVEAIRAEIVQLLHNYAWDSVTEALQCILSFIDSLPDEQPSKDLEEEIKAYFQGYWPVLETAEQCNTNMEFTPPAIMRLAKHFYELGQASVRIPEQPSKGMDVTDFCKPIDPGIAQCIADNWWEMLGEDEKPVLNDLEEVAEEYRRKSYNAATIPPLDGPTNEYGGSVKDAFIAGAKWQAERFEKNRLSNCDTLTKEEYDRETTFAMEIIEKEHRQPTFTDAINYGMRLQKEQMMEDAVECELYRDGDFFASIDIDMATLGYTDNDKVKVIIVKEDEQ